MKRKKIKRNPNDPKTPITFFLKTQTWFYTPYFLQKKFTSTKKMSSFGGIFLGFHIGENLSLCNETEKLIGTHLASLRSITVVEFVM